MGKKESLTGVINQDLKIFFFSRYSFDYCWPRKLLIDLKSLIEKFELSLARTTKNITPFYKVHVLSPSQPFCHKIAARKNNEIVVNNK